MRTRDGELGGAKYAKPSPPRFASPDAPCVGKPKERRKRCPRLLYRAAIFAAVVSMSVVGSSIGGVGLDNQCPAHTASRTLRRPRQRQEQERRARPVLPGPRRTRQHPQWPDHRSRATQRRLRPRRGYRRQDENNPGNPRLQHREPGRDRPTRDVHALWRGEAHPAIVAAVRRLGNDRVLAQRFERCFLLDQPHDPRHLPTVNPGLAR